VVSTNIRTGVGFSYPAIPTSALWAEQSSHSPLFHPAVLDTLPDHSLGGRCEPDCRFIRSGTAPATGRTSHLSCSAFRATVGCLVARHANVGRDPTEGDVGEGPKCPYVVVYARKDVLTRRSLWVHDCLNSSLAVGEKNHFSSLFGCRLLSFMALSNAISMPLSSAAYTVDWLSVPRCLRSNTASRRLTAAAPMWPSKPLPSVYTRDISAKLDFSRCVLSVS
jgi:hypothetical protein